MLTSSFTWYEFFLTALLLGVIYVVLFLLSELNKRNIISEHFPKKFKNGFRQLFIVYELLAMIILVAVFICIKPPLHGLIFLFFALGSISYLRSYINGRWIHFDNAISQGVEIRTPKLQGVVSEMGRFKMHIQTKKGLHHISYSRLLSEGYALVSGEEIGSFHHFQLAPNEKLKNIKNHRLHLLDLFSSAPYVDWHHKPELVYNENESNRVDARVLIKEDSHLHELVALIREWGYHCKLKSR
jgi:hypothetical protein